MAARLESDASPVESSEATGPLVTVGLWLALLVGFSPVLADLLRVYAEHPWARVCLLFPALAWWAASRLEAARPEPARWGLVLVFAGIVIELIAVGSQLVRFGRFGLLLALIGFCAWRGLCSRRTAFLLAWAVPLPATVINGLSPWPEQIYGTALRGLFSSSSMPLQQLGTDLFVQARELPLIPADGGVPVLVAVAGFVWFGAIRSRVSQSTLGRFALVGVSLCVLVQGLILLAGVLVFRDGAAASTIRSGWDLASQLSPVLMGGGLVMWMHRVAQRSLVEVSS